jgi:hypothetical protein
VCDNDVLNDDEVLKVRDFLFLSRPPLSLIPPHPPLQFGEEEKLPSVTEYHMKRGGSR